ncbi:WG repeat-containing protein [Tenacibaculum sp. A30]|uniref:WG repeat-containing protein n=1 Tax=Tenacibaculum sp. A30 TaxID=3442644 RepID=UPI003EBD0492
MKKISLIIITLLANTCFSQKKITADGFLDIIGTKYFMTHENYNKFGFVDNEGNLIIENKLGKFENTKLKDCISENIVFAIDKSTGKKIAFNLDLKKVIYESYNGFVKFGEGIGFVQLLNKNWNPLDKMSEEYNVFAIDKNGNKLFDIQNGVSLNSSYGSFRDNLARVVVWTNEGNTKTVYINKQGKIILSPKEYDSFGDYSEGLVRVRKNVNGDYKWGFIDKDGQEVIGFNFSIMPTSFNEGVSVVKSRDNKYGYINNKGEIIIEPKFKIATGFYKGYALVSEGYKNWKIIDKLGKTIYDYTNLGITSMFPHNPEENDKKTIMIKQIIDNNIMICKKAHKYFYYDIEGNLIFEDKPNFKLQLLKNGYSIVNIKNGYKTIVKKNIVNNKGEIILTTEKSKF